MLDHARASVASLSDATTAELVRDQVRQLRDGSARQKRLENLLVAAYHALPTPNHLDTIPGIGAVTAAVLTAFILDIDRFATPGKLVAYFGVMPIEAASGVDRDGQPRGPRRYVMSQRGNDLVRRYLWMAALSAIRYNPAVRALYARVVAKHPQQQGRRRRPRHAQAVAPGLRHLEERSALRPATTTPGRRRPTSRAVTSWCHRVGRSVTRHVTSRPGRGPQAGSAAGDVSGHRGLYGQRSRSDNVGEGASSTSPISNGSSRWRACWIIWV